MGTEVLSGGEIVRVLVLCCKHIFLCVCVCGGTCVEVILARTARLVFLLHTVSDSKLINPLNLPPAPSLALTHRALF